MTERDLKIMLDHAERRGIEQGIKLMQNRMLLACENGNPISINGKAYFIKSALENLIDIMDDIDAEYGVMREKKYIVTITRTKDLCTTSNDVIVKAPTPHHAMLWAIDEFTCDGWEVDKDYQHYKQL